VLSKCLMVLENNNLIFLTIGSYVNGGHLEFLIHKKKENYVKDYPMIVYV